MTKGPGFAGAFLLISKKSNQRNDHRRPMRRPQVERKKMIKTSKFDAADYLKNPQAMADYLSEALATDDFEYICVALDTIARAKGLTQVAQESLWKSLSDTTKPEFDAVRRAIASLGLRLVAEPIEKTEAA
jgi:probable addiction module antidote protein